ncbi:MAG TPA: LemA family protein [Candidatus Acidoferrales bacterium]
MTLIFLAIIFFLGVGLVLYFVSVYNHLVQLRNDIDKSWSNIDVLLRQRHDELPKLIETCKGYMKYEQETFQKITAARTVFMSATTTGEKIDAANQVSAALRTLFAVAENYPELKANNNFMQLQGRISELETQVADRREFFNDSSNTFNIRIAQLPDLFVARLLSYQPRPLFQAAAEERADVTVKFD